MRFLMFRSANILQEYIGHISNHFSNLSSPFEVQEEQLVRQMSASAFKLDILNKIFQRSIVSHSKSAYKQMVVFFTKNSESI